MYTIFLIQLLLIYIFYLLWNCLVDSIDYIKSIYEQKNYIQERGYSLKQMGIFNIQLTVDGQNGLCGVHVLQHVEEVPSHEHARALTRFHRTAGRIVQEKAPNNRVVTLRDVLVRTWNIVITKHKVYKNHQFGCFGRKKKVYASLHQLFKVCKYM